MKIEILDEIDSTNEYIKRYLPLKEDRIVVALKQTGGRGTKGRSFLSNAGGVYLSALRFYENFPAKNAFRIMAHAATSVCKTAEEFNLSAEIKWPNDVYLSGKKLAGILVENAIEGEKVKSSVVGIGMNVCNDLKGLDDIAISLSMLSEKEISCEEARGILIKKLQEKSSFSDYLNRVRFLGRKVLVTEGEETYFAKAIAITSDGRLEAERGEKRVLLSAAEISLKI